MDDLDVKRVWRTSISTSPVNSHGLTTSLHLRFLIFEENSGLRFTQNFRPKESDIKLHVEYSYFFFLFILGRPVFTKIRNDYKHYRWFCLSHLNFASWKCFQLYSTFMKKWQWVSTSDFDIVSGTNVKLNRLVKNKLFLTYL